MTITLVKKIKRDGQLCGKSARVLADLEARNLLDQIDRIVAADERIDQSEGYALAAQYQVDSAPFFIVTAEHRSPQVYRAYARFLQDIFGLEFSEEEELAEMMAQNPDLDFI